MAVIEVTTQIGCKVACRYCPQETLARAYARRSTQMRMSGETFAACLAQIPREVEIIFGGMGEPFLHPECADMILKAHSKGHRVSVDTTLAGMRRADIEKMQEVLFRYFAVHLASDGGEENIDVDDTYLELLKSIFAGKIKAQDIFFHYYGKAPHPKVKALNLPVKRIELFSRSGNIKIEGKARPARHRGWISCERDLHWNVLLPNGDVTLCSADYGLQHVLGNLLETDYPALFSGEEFRKVEAGLKDDSADILCRLCERYVRRKRPTGFIKELHQRIKRAA